MKIKPLRTSEIVICKNNKNKNISQKFVKISGWKGVRCYQSKYSEDYIEVGVESTHKAAKCPYCHKRSTSVHSERERTLQDLPISGVPVKLKAKVRRFRCNNPQCSHKTFAEQLSGITECYKRRTLRLMTFLEKILVKVAGTVGSHQCSSMGISVSPSTAVRIVRGIELNIDYAAVRHICIDDFSFKKGQVYGTIILDADTHLPLEIIPHRAGEEVERALRKYKNVKTVSRDRSTAYARVISRSLPKAKQVADRFHLMQNLSDRIEKQMRVKSKEIRSEALAGTAYPIEEGLSVDNLHMQPTDKEVELFNAIHALREECDTMKQIAKVLNIDRKTVSKYLSMSTPEGKKAIVPKAAQYFSIIKQGVLEGKSYTDIHKDIILSGGKITYKALRKGIKKLFPEYRPKGGIHSESNSPPEVAKTERRENEQMLSSRVMGIYVTNPEYGIDKKTGKSTDRHKRANKLIENSKILQMIRQVYVTFRQILSGGNPDDLCHWIERYKKSALTEIAAFARSLVSDMNAITNAIRYKYSNGPIEGCNNKLKALKRGMFGRAKFDLLLIRLRYYSGSCLHQI